MFWHCLLSEQNTLQSYTHIPQNSMIPKWAKQRRIFSNAIIRTRIIVTIRNRRSRLLVTCVLHNSKYLHAKKEDERERLMFYMRNHIVSNIQVFLLSIKYNDQEFVESAYQHWDFINIFMVKKEQIIRNQLGAGSTAITRKIYVL